MRKAFLKTQQARRTPEKVSYMIKAEQIGFDINGLHILENVSLHLEPGDIYGLLGPNGAGKSTTIFILLGLLLRDRGEVKVLGSDPAQNSGDIRQSVGVMPEKAGFYDWMTPRDYLQWFTELYAMPISECRLNDLLGDVGLGDSMGRPIGNFSRGMKQRLAVARVLATYPRLLILDEPTNGLDPKGRKDIHDLLRAYAEDHGAGILLCTHILDDVDRLCNRIGILNRGCTLLDGPLAEVTGLASEGRLFRLRMEHSSSAGDLPEGLAIVSLRGGWLHVRVKPEFDQDVSVLWKEAIERGWLIREIHSEEAGLEELYLRTISSLDTVKPENATWKQ